MVVQQYPEQDDHCTNVAQWTVSQSFIFCKCSTTTSRSQHESHDKDKMFVDNTSITQRGTTMVGDNTRQWDNNKPNTMNTNWHARLRHDGYFRISHLYKRWGPTPGSLCSHVYIQYIVMLSSIPYCMTVNCPPSHALTKDNSFCNRIGCPAWMKRVWWNVGMYVFVCSNKERKINKNNKTLKNSKKIHKINQSLELRSTTTVHK